MGCEGRPWQLLHNYVYSSRYNMKGKTKREREKERNYKEKKKKKDERKHK